MERITADYPALLLTHHIPSLHASTHSSHNTLHVLGLCVLMCTHLWDILKVYLIVSDQTTHCHSVSTATCRASPHVVMGTQVKWQLLSGRLVDGDNCSFTTGESSECMAVREALWQLTSTLPVLLT